MRETDLPSPNIGAKGFHLRRIAAQAMNQMAVVAVNYPGGQHPDADDLKAFFDAASVIAADLGKLNTVPTFTPTAKSYSVAAGATAGPTLSKGGSAGTATYTSSDPAVATVNSSTGAVTGVAPGTCTITVSIAATGTYRAGTGSYVATVTA